jgi:tetratricopeptide (TPR) repeat protein
VRIAELAPGEAAWRKRLKGYALAHLGNARRVGGDLPAAEEAFGRARELWEAGVLEPAGLLEAARLYNLQASLRIDQWRLPEALALLEQALAMASGYERKTLLLKRATALELAGDSEGAIAALLEAVPFVSEEREPRLLWVLRFNLANNLLQTGRPREAEAWLPELRRLTLGNELDALRLHWLEGRIAAGLGERKRAVEILTRVREDFATQKIAYDAALVSMEIAVLLLEDRRIREVRSLARQILWIFRAQDVHREALAALRLFCEAAERETATLEMTRRISEYLLRARNEPGLRLEDL